MKISEKFKISARFFITTALISVLALACGEGDGDEEESNDSSSFPNSAQSYTPAGSLQLPQTRSIELTSLGEDPSLSLAETNKCASADGRGMFSLALGGACHTSSFASDLLLGETNGGDFNSDGTIDCDDYTYANQNSIEAGIMFHLTCGELFQQFAVRNFAFEEEGENGSEAIGVSFADFTGDTNTGVGTWYGGSSESYPANIRIYQSTSVSSLSEILALDLETDRKGSLWVNFEGMEGKVTFDLKSDTSSCAASPSTTNCHYQEVKLYNTSPTGGDEAPLGFHLTILADNILDPTYMLLEGRYNYADVQASGFDFDTNASDIREIYFVTTQTGTNLWGQFYFYDTNGNAISWANGGLDTYLNGPEVCLDLTQSGDTGTTASCTTGKPSDTSVFAGRTNLDLISSSLLSGIDFDTGKPTAVGLE